MEEANQSKKLEWLWNVLLPQERLRKDFINSGKLLVHYTQNAPAILKSGELWLANPRDMSDETEIKLGRECVEEFLSDNAKALSDVLCAIRPSLYHDLLATWKSEYNAHIFQTYIACFTEQDADDTRGSTYHWKNYGKTAMCLNPAFLRDEPSQLSLYLEKVVYGKSAIMSVLEQFLISLYDNKESLANFASTDENLLLSFLRHRLFFTSVASKDVGFAQECEWRLIYSPYLFASSHLLPKKNPGGKSVEALPLSTPSGTQISDLTLDKLIARVMIHHTFGREAAQHRLDIISQLTYRQVKTAHSRVSIIDSD